MAVADRVLTPETARAALSWRLLLGGAVGTLAWLVGVPTGVAVAIGLGVWVGAVLAATPRGRHGSRPADIDPFVLSEPWRQLMQQAQRSERALQATARSGDAGPLRETLVAVADQLRHGLEEAWAVACAGDDLDDAVRLLDPVGLDAKLVRLRSESGDDPSPDQQAAISSLNRQLDTVRRLKEQSAQTESSLRLAQTQLDELVARASEIRLAQADTDTYLREVDELVIRLESLHRAVEEISTT